MDINDILDNTVEDALDDEEVRFYMMERIQKDICLCKKYGKSNKRKPCPLCFDFGYTTPKKQLRKYPQHASGNFGRTGCLKKPDLCSIPEHNIVIEFTAGDMSTSNVVRKQRKVNKALLSEIRQPNLISLPEYKPSRPGRTFLVSNSTAETRSKANVNRSVLLPNADDESRLEVNGTVNDRVKLNGSNGCRFELNGNAWSRVDLIGCTENGSKFNGIVKGHAKTNGTVDGHLQTSAPTTYSIKHQTPESKRTNNNDRAVLENGVALGGKAGDAKRGYCGEGETVLQWKKPKLIPAPDFLKRYFPLPPINSKFTKTGWQDNPVQCLMAMEMKGYGKTERKMYIPVADNVDYSNVTDDQKLINDMSHVTIDHDDIGKRMHE